MVVRCLPNDRVSFPVVIDGVEFTIIVKSDICSSFVFDIIEDRPVISIISND